MTINSSYRLSALAASVALAASMTLAHADDSGEEPGEASYNVEDCEPAGDADKQGDVDQKDLDECKSTED